MKVILTIVGVIIVLFILVSILGGFVGTVGAGERGVMTRFGAVTGEVLDEGLYFKTPIAEDVVKMDVKIQKDEVTATAASKDLQDVSVVIAVNHRIQPSRVADIYQNIGRQYKKDAVVSDRLIAPAIQESVKSSTARYTAEELITKREAVRNDIKKQLEAKLTSRGVIVEDLNIVDFKFSKAFSDAIEAKVTAEQNALASKNKLAQVEYEAQQAVALAKGKAEAIQIEAQALQNNPQVLELRALEKWNGVLPQVTGESVPFINVK